jgi:hypothetical protein
MPRVHYEDLDLDLSFLGSEFDEITLQIWGKESLEDLETPENSGTKTIVHEDRSNVHEDRSIKLSPALQAVFVNEETHETLTFSITGASHTSGDTTVATGRNILGDQFDNEVVLTIGRFQYSIIDEVASPLTGHGREIPLSDLLAPLL